ncbi:MAG: hypothetical protein AAGE37_04640 [Pseudomonadota bacterium]
MDERVDWSSIAETLGTITRTAEGRSESGGSVVAVQALNHILGDQFFLDAVEHTLSWHEGNETSRSVLHFLRPKIAAERCIHVFRTTPDDELASDAIHLLSDVAELDALNWLDEIFESENYLTRVWGLRVIDQLWMRGLGDDEAINLIEPILKDQNAVVVGRARELINMIKGEDDET